MNRSGTILKRLTSMRRLASPAAGSLLLLFACGESEAQPPREAGAGTVRGKIVRFTNAPRGEVDGAVLEDGIWLHWPPHLQERFTGVLKEGDRVRATGRRETGPAGDTHFEIQSLTNLRTNARAENPDFANGPRSPGRGPRDRARKGPPPPPNREQITTVHGKIERFTTAPRGEEDGALLEDGTWLHWPPRMQDRFTSILKAGDRVRASGRTEAGPAGDTHFEVQSVTDLRSNLVAENPDFSGPTAEPGPAEGNADRKQRLRDLEDQVQQILREIQRRRREK